MREVFAWEPGGLCLPGSIAGGLEPFEGSSLWLLGIVPFRDWRLAAEAARAGPYTKDFEPEVGRALAKGLGGRAIGQKRDADVAAAGPGRLGGAAQRFGQLGRLRKGGRDDRQVDVASQGRELDVRACRRLDDGARVV